MAKDKSDLYTKVDTYISGLMAPEDEALTAALQDMREAGLPEIQVSPAQGKLLYLLARAQRARAILELGALGGYSAIWMARALPADGRLITLEYDPAFAEVARRNIARAGLADRVDIRVGAALDSLPKLQEEGAGPFDLVFIDADKPPYADYFEWALRLSRPGTLIIADNVIRGGRVVAPDGMDDRSVAGVMKMNAAIAANSAVEATILQTVGSKGHDGFTLALVK